MDGRGQSGCHAIRKRRSTLGKVDWVGNQWVAKRAASESFQVVTQLGRGWRTRTEDAGKALRQMRGIRGREISRGGGLKAYKLLQGEIL